MRLLLDTQVFLWSGSAPDEDLHLVTADRRLRDYPEKVVW